MLTEKYNRRPFPVEAVQVAFENIHDVAEWCKGTVVTQKTKMLGVEADVPAIRVPGQGESRGKDFIATLGCYIVELKGSFRVYKPAQFDATFVKIEEVGNDQVIEDGCRECGNDEQHRAHVLRMQYVADLHESDIEGADPIAEKVRLNEYASSNAAGPLVTDNSTVDGQETSFVNLP